MSAIRWIPCTDPASTCTASDWSFQGVAGVCSNATQICSCPEGYDGRDDLFNWNDCHVDEHLREIAHAVTFALSVTACVCAFSALVKLLFKWGVLFWRIDADLARSSGNSHDKGGKTQSAEEAKQAAAGSLRDRARMSVGSSEPAAVTLDTSAPPIRLESATHLKSPEPDGHAGLGGEERPKSDPKRMSIMVVRQASVSGSLTALKMPKTNVKTSTFTQEVAEVRRRRHTLVLIGCFAFYAWYVVAIYAYLLAGTVLGDRAPFMLWSVAGGFCCMLWSLWILTLSWFSSLPSLRTFAKMFPSVADSFLVQHPSFLRSMAVFNMVLAGVMAYLFFFILPLALTNNDDLVLVVRIGITILASLVLVFLACILAVARLLLKMFASFSGLGKTSKASNSEVSSPQARASKTIQRFNDARRTVVAVVVIGVLAGPIIVVLLLLMAWYPRALGAFYVFLAVIICSADVVVMFLSYVLVYRMAQDNAPKRRVSEAGEDFQRRMSKQSRGSKDEGAAAELVASPASDQPPAF